MIELGKAAPEFTLPDQDGKEHSLSDYKGQKVVIYFYPKDMTPGCTVQAEGIRDAMNDLKEAGIQVLGISTDPIESHKKFVEKHDLNFPLLADTEKSVVEKYGVWVEKSMFGKKYMGTQRDSFLINESGVVTHHFKKVKPKEHVSKILKAAAE